MLTIGGYKLKENLKIISGLQKIFGIGWNKANQIVNLLGIKKNMIFKDMNYFYQLKLNKIIIHYVHGFRAKRNLKNNISFLKESKSYRGVRHDYFLSVRGQKTRTNAKTQRNKKNKKRKQKK